MDELLFGKPCECKCCLRRRGLMQCCGCSTELVPVPVQWNDAALCVSCLVERRFKRVHDKLREETAAVVNETGCE